MCIRDSEEDEQNEPSQEVLTTDVGLNRFVWDLRYEKAREIPGAIYDEGDPIGALALPGSYQVKLTAGGRSYVQPIEIRLDPRVKIADADLQKQFELVSKLRDVMDQMHAAVLQMRSVHEQLLSLIHIFTVLQCEARKARTAFNPPNANEFERAYSTRATRGWFGM